MSVRALALALGVALSALAPPLAAADRRPATGAHPPSAPSAARTSFQALSGRAATARAAGRRDEAATLYKRALTLRPAWAEGRLALATLLLDLKRYPEARENLQRLTGAGEGGGEAWALLGLVSSRLRDYDTAMPALANARRAGIASPEILSAVMFEAALLLNRAGNHDGAFEILRAFASAGKDGPSVITAFGLCMLRLREMPDELAPEKRDRVRLAGRGGYQMARARRTAVGRLALEELVSRYPAEPNAHYALGTYLVPDDPDAAIEEFRRELRLTPDHVEALIQIAHLETRRGDAAVALPLAEKAVAVAPDVPAGRLVLGRALLELDRTDDAIVQLERAATLAPENGDVHFALSRAYQRAGRTDDASRARDEFQRLEKLKSVSNEPGGLN